MSLTDAEEYDIIFIFLQRLINGDTFQQKIRRKLFFRIKPFVKKMLIWHIFLKIFRLGGDNFGSI